MKLSYRGVSYESADSMVESSTHEITGKYRGVPVRFGAPVVIRKNPVQLTYRGNSYLGMR